MVVTLFVRVIFLCSVHRIYGMIEKNLIVQRETGGKAL